MASIVLHQWEMSPFCNKARRCLRHKGLDFEVRNYNGLKARKAATLSEVGTLPVLDHDDSRIVDSKRIAEFLDQQYPDAPRLYPDDAVARAQAHVWEDWAGQSLYFFEVRFRMLDIKARAKALALTGEPLSAEQAADWGLIWKCVADEDLKTFSGEIAKRLAEGPATALACIKKAVAAVSAATDYAHYIAVEADLQQKAGMSPDYGKNVLAFLEKKESRHRA